MFVPEVLQYVWFVSDSSTAKHLRSSGITAVSQQAWGKISAYTKQGFRYDLTFLVTYVCEQSLDYYTVYVACLISQINQINIVCQIFVECISLLGFVLVDFCTLCLTRGR